MVLWATILILQGAGLVGSMPGNPGVPENITVMFVNPTSVRVSWSMRQVDSVDKYDVTYKPTDASQDRVVAIVAGNSEAVTLSGLRADTQYQLFVTAVRAGIRLRSRPIVFRTLEPPKTSPQQDAAGAVTGGPVTPPGPPSAHQPQAYIQIRGVEVGIVVLVLVVWAGAIALFFNRWGKIRMLLPYQPDYKEQLKVPGTGVCAAATNTCNQHSTQHACSQHLHWSNHHVDSLDSAGGLGWPRPTRPRVNSAIDVAGFLSQEFVRRHGSTSRLCRKVRSADNLPLAASSNRQHDQRGLHNLRDDLGEDERPDDREIFFKSSSRGNQDSRESRERRTPAARDEEDASVAQINLEKVPKETEPSSQEASYQLHSLREAAGTTPSLMARRFGGWRVSGSHEYVRCPVRQPASIDERYYRRSCEPDFARLGRHHNHQSHHHQQLHSDHHSKSCDYARRATPETSGTETQHFGLPILSISEPSPPDEMDRVDEYL
ncbi:uncharacterized protein LOC124304579 isoform X2 [Neodiprion virginianus]|uniref:Uncharacterized protein LOC107217350 isoform X2 n=1 Tax=Neodiprion lecontei TaxID=441921 RepID=A0ABM3G672_NEOLC|nr:uncharacterized protein LOC124182284 isoform X2 [Neodiprion fabricii]XP_046481783.1 uncharacterized protein LOC124218907 isoform X2 [Neodiprion pinetum]XP_046595766.1 uncharacterized protein LOC107217350 isoform X2 [Neodiprion lecontei]XP_046618941.1 uncharacterized protein LOC124304579 isoform X2 [Neodiprion virginianus]